MATFLIIGDLHENLPAIREILGAVRRLDPAMQPSAVILTGDFLNFPMAQSEGLHQELAAATMVAIEQHLRLFRLPVFCVGGNHDLPDLSGADGCLTSVDVFAGRQPAVMAGVRIVGVGGSWRLGGFPYEWDDDEVTYERIAGAMPERDGTPEVLLSHAPPIGCNVGFTDNGEEVGSHAIRKLIVTREPCVNICGHLHEGAGWGVLGETYILNAGAAASGDVMWQAVPNSGPFVRLSVDVFLRLRFTLLRISRSGPAHHAMEAAFGPMGWSYRMLVLESGKIRDSVCTSFDDTSPASRD